MSLNGRKRNKRWFKGLLWAERMINELGIPDGTEAVSELCDLSMNEVLNDPFDNGASDYCLSPAYQKKLQVHRAELANQSRVGRWRNV